MSVSCLCLFWVAVIMWNVSSAVITYKRLFVVEVILLVIHTRHTLTMSYIGHSPSDRLFLNYNAMSTWTTVRHVVRHVVVGDYEFTQCNNNVCMFAVIMKYWVHLSFYYEQLYWTTLNRHWSKYSNFILTRQVCHLSQGSLYTDWKRKSRFVLRQAGVVSLTACPCVEQCVLCHWPISQYWLNHRPATAAEQAAL